MVRLTNVLLSSIFILALGSICAPVIASDTAPVVNFAREVRPILANNCFHCHGPDAAERKADLRLDVRDSVGDLHGAQTVIDSKNPAQSELVKRITSDDPDQRMPPADSGKTLRPEQV